MNFQAHLTITLIIIALFWLLNSVFGYLDLTLTEASIFTMLCLASGLGPDIDSTHSKPRRWVKNILISAFMISIIFLIIIDSINLTITILLTGTLILLLKSLKKLKHRGILHSKGFILIVGAGLFYVLTIQLQFKPFVTLGWFLGAGGHLLLDKMI